jgi:transcriptional regulator of acetoin/glycerol metabolism
MNATDLQNGQNTLTHRAALQMAMQFLGGAELLKLADRHFGAGERIDDLAAESGIARSTLYRRLNVLHQRLAQFGAVPTNWNRHASHDVG